MKLCIVGIALALTGCAGNPPVPFAGPSGNPAYSLGCGGLGNSLARCYRRAAELCPTGYGVVDRNSVYDGTVISHQLVVECKP